MMATAAWVALPAAAQQVDEVNRLVDEGMNHSQVMQTAQEMTDGLGPRLTNSPGMRRAEAWAMDKFSGWGLANVRRDGFEFGRGWEIVSVSTKMLTPRPLALTAIPIAWTPGTDGAITAPVIVAPMTKEEHFAEWRGKLAGKIVMVTLPGTGDEPDKAPFRRLSAAQTRSRRRQQAAGAGQLSRKARRLSEGRRRRGLGSPILS
jgi:carboxypeptidase Q